ncbi:hypothetical protein AWENTII_011332 [Aspergillus wentii]
MLIINNKDIPGDANVSLSLEAVQSSAAAFPSWSKSPPSYRRALLNKTASLLRERYDGFRALLEEEVHMPPLFATKVNLDGGIALLEETAAVLSDSMTGCIPYSEGNSYAMVFKEAMGVVLGIAPWNAPVILGLRAVGSELSPKTHFLLANLFRDAGFPPGVVNFLLSTPADAPAIYETIINHSAVKKCNFTGSTGVGRIIGSKAALALKPVLLELGGKNLAVVLEDADVEDAAGKIVLGGYLNNGQICMSTDLVLAVEPIAQPLINAILTHLQTQSGYQVIAPATKTRLDNLIADARSKGAIIHQSPSPCTTDLSYPATVIENVTPSMAFYTIEAFGPIFGILRVPTAEAAIAHTQASGYGLSAAIFTKSHFRALGLAEQIPAGAVHVNGMTVHDEATLPHGGMGESGFGRFGARWGVEEFLTTRTVILNP